MAHAVAAAVGVPSTQRARNAVGVGAGMARLHQRSTKLIRGASQRLRIERIAAEQIDFLQSREETIVWLTARDALHFVDGQKFARIDVLGKEFVATGVIAAVVMP
ncbi:MAG: hypothetical protein ACM34F_06255 [Betaproteobacteria bacterium]